MTDQQLIAQLIAHDPQTTAQFFFRDCRPLFLSVIRRVFGTQIVDYDEIISELYLLLMEDDAKRLRQFNFQSTLYQWLKTIAIRHCLKLKLQGQVIDDEAKEPLNERINNEPRTEPSQAKLDLEALLRQMKNQRYALVIRLLMIEEYAPADVAQELHVKVGNLYNIKRRAMTALTEVALKDKKHYERK